QPSAHRVDCRRQTHRPRGQARRCPVAVCVRPRSSAAPAEDRSRGRSLTADLMAKPRILVIDDEAAIRDSLRMTLEYEGYDYIAAATGQEGLALAEREAPDLVVLDIKMPGMDGIEVLDRLRAINETLPVIVISGHGTVPTAVE